MSNPIESLASSAPSAESVPPPNGPHGTPLETMAAALLALPSDGDGPDFLEALTALEALMPLPSYIALANMIEACPMHHCDAQICRDDEIAECESVR